MKPEKRSFWARVFAANQAALSGFLRRRLAHASDVQDLAQEVYVRMLHVDQASANSISNPRAYLFTVASNLIKEHALLQKRHALDFNITEMLDELESSEPSAEDKIEQEFCRRHMTAVLDGLPPRCKAVLLMQHRDGMSYGEIAEHLGVSTHMVKKYVVRALTLCRQELARSE